MYVVGDREKLYERRIDACYLASLLDTVKGGQITMASVLYYFHFLLFCPCFLHFVIYSSLLTSIRLAAARVLHVCHGFSSSISDTISTDVSSGRRLAEARLIR